jgi:hypothetical protein
LTGAVGGLAPFGEQRGEGGEVEVVDKHVSQILTQTSPKVWKFSCLYRTR